MKKFLMATALTSLAAVSAQAASHAETLKIGVILGFTGPLESLAPPMAGGAELALNEINAAGGILDGKMLEAVRGDGTCADSAAATAAAERLVTSDGVVAIMGAMCSGATGAVLTNVALPNGVLQISPSATSPGLSSIEDNGLFFRMAPSDARQGQVMAEILGDRGISSVALTYTNNDYGSGLASSFQEAFEAAGGSVTLSAAHEDGKADYSAEVGSLASAGGDALVVIGYVDEGGSGVIQAALDTGAFDTFVLPDGMIGAALEEKFGSDIDGSFGQNPSVQNERGDEYIAMAEAAGFDGTSAYAKEGYDSMALILLSMAAAGSTTGADAAAKVMELANAPGEKIYAGELAKALEIIAGGGDIDYVGASSVELIAPGEASGGYVEVEMKDGKLEEIGYR
ncbi:ABC transporter substrate-binding protein [Marinovum sp. 2_MG-2023]|uniref:ABC transporter substrate-binding protein n=1 Tax=unclassified Marinovum TaxID=2647166 RepID=UPI0026E12BDD|nr:MULTISPECIES: ABC transporter substrate-binding protein [unclassified Marinovum]MDO6732237.1 ABC transporter substrate-binding protein [Marinovum sp. 2_MG-2023]MDO6781543.1 ABC transporter substrate-binding protein [Marinovum sp. 1_MG-2023]